MPAARKRKKTSEKIKKNIHRAAEAIPSLIAEHLSPEEVDQRTKELIEEWKG